MAGDRPALLGLLLYLPIAVGSTLVFWVALRALPAGLRVFGERRVALQPAYDETSPTVCDQVGAHSPLTEAVGATARSPGCRLKRLRKMPES